MACICQYFVTVKNRKQLEIISDCSGETSPDKDNILQIVEDRDKSLFSNIEVSATELAASRAEIWLLKRNLTEAQISIENLENLVKTIIAKQNELLSEMYQLKTHNGELQDECRMQRDYQTMERNAMIRELHDIKVLLSDRTKLLEETVFKNSELTNALQDANEKIYMMGMKFLKLKSSRSKQMSLMSASSASPSPTPSSRSSSSSSSSSEN